MNTPHKLSPCHCLNIRWIANKMISDYDDLLKPSGLTSQQFSVLMALSQESPRTVTALSNYLRLDRTTLSRNIKILLDQDLIEYTTPRGRAKLLTLTTKGSETFTKAESFWAEAQNQFTQKLSPEKLALWNKLIEELL